MLSQRILNRIRGLELDDEERAVLERAVSTIRTLPPRTTLTRAGEPLEQSTLLLDGFISRYIDDRKGLRQLVAVHVPGDFADLHSFPLKRLDHDVATMTEATIALVPHAALEDCIAELPGLGRKLWFETLIDAAIHRAWLFRLGRLDAVGRVAHFLCETNVRLAAVDLSDGESFAMGLTQADLAEICGLTTVHVNRVLRQLRDDGLCVFRSSRVTILDPARLAARAQFRPDYLYITHTVPFFPEAGEA